MKRFLFGLATLTMVVSGANLVTAGSEGDGHVLPETATPSGYSLVDMAEELAYFSTSGNDLNYYPDTPFQILYVDPTTGTNTFTVKPGTRFFVPVAYFDDSPPIFGDFPSNEDDIAAYVFGSAQLGGHDVAIVVDGHTTKIGPDYAVGVHTPGLLDGGGSNYIQIGAFLTPLSKGTHTVTIQGIFDGDAVLSALGGPFSFEISYTVIVKN